MKDGLVRANAHLLVRVEIELGVSLPRVDQHSHTLLPSERKAALLLLDLALLLGSLVLHDHSEGKRLREVIGV